MTEQNQQSLLLGKIAAYTEILVKDPSSTIFVSLAETYRRMGMYEDAHQIINKGMILHADFSPAYVVLARILCQLEDFTGSVSAFEHALEVDEDNLAALVGCARVQILLAHDDLALALLLRARALSPADPIINKLIISLSAVDQVALEVTQTEPATADDPSDKTVELVSPTLAELYLAQGLNEKALDLYRQLSTRNPDDLTFRRKVKELEGAVVAKDIELVPEAVVAPIATVEDDLDDDETFVFEPEIEAENSKILETLNGWLQNIQQRRDNV